MDKTVMQGKMRQARGKMKERWAKLTDDDMRKIDGRLDQVLGLIQERYGYTRQGASDELRHYVEEYGKSTQNLIDDLADKLESRGFLRSLWLLIPAAMGAVFLLRKYMMKSESSEVRRQQQPHTPQ